MTLFSLTYVSASTNLLNENQLKDLLYVCKDKNRLIDVTGMLLYRNGYFIQVLEGEKDIVETLYAKIKNDPRHMNALVVSREVITNRNFNAWSMGFSDIERMNLNDLRKLDGFTEYLSQPFSIESFRDNPTRAVRLLEMFKNHAI